MKQIKVRCIESVQHFFGRILLCDVKEGDELTADLYEETEEYFATDSQGRELYVGCLDMDGKLVLQDFELVEEGADTE
jgi:hypothetical protein